jgi:beta-lactamase class C
MRFKSTTCVLSGALLFPLFAGASQCATASNTVPSGMKSVVEAVVPPLMQKYSIPGMAVAVTIDGQRSFFNYGLASQKGRAKISNKTLFEIGSVSKTFTATLASFADVEGELSLSDSVSKHLPALSGTSFDSITLLNLGTHTSGGLPLQVPDQVKTDEQLMDYLKRWKPLHTPGTQRSYSNPSIGLLGLITAKCMNQSFEDAIEKRLLPELGMFNTYINLPGAQANNYAQGYSKNGSPMRMNAGVLSSEAYGLKSCTSDMVKFVEANMHVLKLGGNLEKAIDNTHTGYFKFGESTQDLVWEQYSYPVQLKRLLSGNSSAMIFESNRVTKLNPPLEPQLNVWMNKTGSTNGFSSYVAFIPSKKMGIVLLANKNYPIEARVEAAYKILTEDKLKH